MPADVAAAVRAARPAWVAHGANASLEVLAPDAPSDFRDAEVAAALQWVSGVLQ